jgi:hypothetical protein
MGRSKPKEAQPNTHDPGLFQKPTRYGRIVRNSSQSSSAKKMQLEVPGIGYIPVDIAYNPRPGGLAGTGKRRFHARNLGGDAMQMIRGYK